MEAPLPDPRPRLPERYELMRLLGQGGMGAVWLARDKPLDRLVAIKVLLDPGRGRSEALARFSREAKAMASFEHPNLVRLFDVDLGGPTPHLAMEYVAGLPLDRVIERHAPLPPDHVIRWGRELAGALAAMHRAGVLHRDLKPGNVMIRKAGEGAVLMDLGLVRAETGTQLTGTGKMVGTPAYLPPEAIEGAGAWTPASDQFQLGAILFEALTKVRRVPGDDLESLSAALLAGRLADWPPTPPLEATLKRVVATAAAADPAARFPTVEALAAALAACALPGELTGSVIAFPEPSRSLALRAAPSPPAAPPAASPRPVLPALALVVALAAGAWFLAPAPAPHEVRIEVVGDAAVATGKAGHARDLRLELGDRTFPAVPQGLDGDFRVVARGLDPERPTAVRLAWAGGAGTARELVAGPPAIEGDPRAGEGRQVRLGLLRPIKARWGGEPEGGVPLETGAGGLLAPPYPLPGESLLTWLDQGVPQARPLVWGPFLRREFERLLDALDPVDVEARGRDGPSLDPERALWDPLAAWLPDLMRAEVPDELKRRAFVSFERYERSLSAERVRGGTPRPMASVAGVLGLRFLGDLEGRRDAGPVAPSVRVLPLEPVGGYDHVLDDPRGLELSTVGSARLPNPRYGRAAQALRFRWPDDAPRRAATLLLALDVVRLSDSAQLRVRPAAPGAPGLAVHVWNPSTTVDAANGSFQGWIGVGLPAELAWEPGAALVVEMAPLSRAAYNLGWVRAVTAGWVSW